MYSDTKCQTLVDGGGCACKKMILSFQTQVNLNYSCVVADMNTLNNTGHIVSSNGAFLYGPVKMDKKQISCTAVLTLIFHSLVFSESVYVLRSHWRHLAHIPNRGRV